MIVFRLGQLAKQLAGRVAVSVEGSEILLNAPSYICGIRVTPSSMSTSCVREPTVNPKGSTFIITDVVPPELSRTHTLYIWRKSKIIDVHISHARVEYDVRGRAVHIEFPDRSASRGALECEARHIRTHDECLRGVGLVVVRTRDTRVVHCDQAAQAGTRDGGVADRVLLGLLLRGERNHVGRERARQRRVGDRRREADGAVEQQRDADGGGGGRGGVVVQQLNHSPGVAALDRKLARRRAGERRDGQRVVGRVEVVRRPRDGRLQLVLGGREVHGARNRDGAGRDGLDVGQRRVQGAARDRVGRGLRGGGVEGERVLLERQGREDAAALDGVGRVLRRHGVERERRGQRAAVERSARAGEQQVLHVQAARDGHVARKGTVGVKGKVAGWGVLRDRVGVDGVDAHHRDGRERLLIRRHERVVDVVLDEVGVEVDARQAVRRARGAQRDPVGLRVGFQDGIVDVEADHARLRHEGAVRDRAERDAHRVLGAKVGRDWERVGQQQVWGDAELGRAERVQRRVVGKRAEEGARRLEADLGLAVLAEEEADGGEALVGGRADLDKVIGDVELGGVDGGLCARDGERAADGDVLRDARVAAHRQVGLEVGAAGGLDIGVDVRGGGDGEGRDRRREARRQGQHAPERGLRAADRHDVAELHRARDRERIAQLERRIHDDGAVEERRRADAERRLRKGVAAGRDVGRDRQRARAADGER
eukprot:6182124-Pleurochrysis_carterae.AAC.2